MSHLENLVSEYYDWKGYLVKRNIKVGKRTAGGWDMELDVVAYHPHTRHLVHVEPSVDAHSWITREQRFKKKFQYGEKYIFTEVFTWLSKDTPIDRIAVLISHPKDRDHVAGARIVSMDEFMLQIKNEIIPLGIVAKNAIPEQYPMLRTIQLMINGYFRAL